MELSTAYDPAGGAAFLPSRRAGLSGLDWRTAIVLFAALHYWGLRISVAIAVLFSPAMLENVTFGQNGTLTAALQWAALLLVPARPAVSGIAAGLLIIKPQFGILLPIAFIAQRSWRVIVVAILAAAGLAVVTAAAFGFDAWVMFWTHTRPLMPFILIGFATVAWRELRRDVLERRAAGCA